MCLEDLQLIQKLDQSQIIRLIALKEAKREITIYDKHDEPTLIDTDDLINRANIIYRFISGSKDLEKQNV